MNLIVAAMYSLPEVESRVCLGLRIGDEDQVSGLAERLLIQVRKRFPEFFEGMTLGEVRKKIYLQGGYTSLPASNGFPIFLGEAGWWAE